MEGGEAEQMKHNNGRGDPPLLGFLVSIPRKVWAGASVDAHDGNQGGNFDYRTRDTLEALPAGTSP